MNKPVMCLGIIVADVIGRPMRAFPEPGRLVLVDEMGLYTGGCAQNAAINLATIGLPVDVIGKIGSDALGNFVLEEMKRHGVGTAGVRRDSSAGTSASMVMVDPCGERRFVHYIGTNARLALDDIDREMIRSSSILLVAGALVLPGIDGAPMAELLEFARSVGVITFLDTAWDDSGSWMRLIGPCLQHVDYFLPSLVEAQVLTGLTDPLEIAKALLDMGVKNVALKMGELGCLVATSTGGVFRLPAFDVPVVDTTGAGDAFVAGFITGVWMGWPIEQCARFANAVGALCVTGLSAAGGVCSLGETENFMNTTKLLSKVS